MAGARLELRGHLRPVKRQELPCQIAQLGVLNEVMQVVLHANGAERVGRRMGHLDVGALVGAIPEISNPKRFPGPAVGLDGFAVQHGPRAVSFRPSQDF